VDYRCPILGRRTGRVNCAHSNAALCRISTELSRSAPVYVNGSGGVSAAAAELDAERFEDLCEELSRRNGALPVSLWYEFVHALHREAFYHRPALGRRVKRHQRIEEQLEALYAGFVLLISCYLKVVDVESM
jgi:hypothetical protein